MSPQQVDGLSILIHEILDKQCTMGTDIAAIKEVMAEQRGEKRGERRVVFLLGSAAGFVSPLVLKFIGHILGVNA